MTIDLGFAWMSLATEGSEQEEEIGIVDVPGHRDFIENMLAGIGGIDAALFVIAADEGVMPQTREHLAILDLLQIQGGVVVMTKIDLVNDPDWLDLVELDIHDVLRGTVLKDLPVVRVSARSGSGLNALKSALSKVLASKPERQNQKRPRLPVDRVFTIAGFGTVATGTLQDGSLKVGDEIEILPAGLRGRVRGLQTHKQKEQIAVPGSRTAVNVSGISLEEIQRGNVIAYPNSYIPTQRMDVRFRFLPDVEGALKHNTEVKLFIGTSEVVARLRLLGVEELAPGAEGWLQLELSAPVIALRGDRYILRRPSPGETLGGGSVVDPHPKRRHKRFSPAVIENLAAILQGKPSDVLLQALQAAGIVSLKEVSLISNLDQETANQALAELFTQGEIINLDGEDQLIGSTPNDQLITQIQWNFLCERIQSETASYHSSYPLRRGLPREQLKSRIKEFSKVSPRFFNSAMRKLIAAEILKEAGPLVYLPDHAVRFDTQTQAKVDRLLKQFESAGYSPPSVKECQAEIGEEAFDALLDMGSLIGVAPEIVFRRDEYERMLADVREMITKNGAITVAEARDRFNTSRRYVLAFLEHLDAAGITQRSGDVRRLKRPI